MSGLCKKTTFLYTQFSWHISRDLNTHTAKTRAISNIHISCLAMFSEMSIFAFEIVKIMNERDVVNRIPTMPLYASKVWMYVQNFRTNVRHKDLHIIRRSRSEVKGFRKFSSLSLRFLTPLLFLLFIFFCARNPVLAEWYMRSVYPVIATALSFISRLVPFSLLDILVIIAVVLLLGSIVMVSVRRIKFFRWVKVLLLSILWIVVWFYMSWGIGYFRLGFYERFEVVPPEEDRAFFEELVIRYIDSINQAYVSEPFFDAKEINKEIEALYEKHSAVLRLPYPCGWRNAKKTISNPLMTRMGVAGYFGPFFNEVHVNNYSLPITYPYTLAHEKAHQFGMANEAECNLFATIICTSSNHPLVRYSGYLQTVSYLLSNLRKISPDRYREIAGQIDPRIMADYRAIQDHWQKELNQTMSDVQNKVYDTYLKTNNQRSGVLSYSEMTGLLVAWELMQREVAPVGN